MWLVLDGIAPGSLVGAPPLRIPREVTPNRLMEGTALEAEEKTFVRLLEHELGPVPVLLEFP